MSVLVKLIDAASPTNTVGAIQRPILSRRVFAAYSAQAIESGVELVLSVEQAQHLVISLFRMLPAEERPVLGSP